MYENVTPKEAGMLLSERFHIPISESSEIPEETRQRANEARLKRERVIARQLQIQTELREICAYLIAYNQLIVESKPFSDVWCYCQEELPKAIGKWEIVFAALEKK
jgi:hypothetical protein